MGRRTTLRPRQDNKGRPSTFFLVAIVIGLVLLAWGFIASVRKPAKPKPVKASEDIPLHHHEPLVDLSTAFEL